MKQFFLEALDVLFAFGLVTFGIIAVIAPDKVNTNVMLGMALIALAGLFLPGGDE